MTAIARELDEKLKALDAQSAATLEKAVRDAIQKAVINHQSVPGWPPDFFKKLAEEWGPEPFERPPQGEFEKREDW